MAQAPAVGDRKSSLAVHFLIAIAFPTSLPYTINSRSLRWTKSHYSKNHVFEAHLS
ncbi:hypothetical protein [Nostoc sp. NZL]|uniref:hypothetical protein n=1 Tax=Nostoc sp. NZL TaxID=2650612 RepID=UPI0018C67864|nr:hypothetical protein [Nostoc sp. NZL]